jgi:Ca2+-binding EF-hand superfamily protein
MQISSTSTAYGGSQAQRLLSMLLPQQGQQQGTGAGQDLPGAPDAASGGASPPQPASGGPSASQFATATLSSLLTTQQAPPSSADIANKVIGAVDTDGDGQLSLDEIEKALGQDTTSGTDAPSLAAMSQAFAKLDANGDGKISGAELAGGLDAQKAQQASTGTPPAGVHRHHHAHHASSADLALQIFGQADTNGDGALSADEISSTLGGSATSATDSLTQAIGKLDANGDGSLSTAELSAAIDAFRAAHKQGSADSAQTATTQAVTA